MNRFRDKWFKMCAFLALSVYLSFSVPHADGFHTQRQRYASRMLKITPKECQSPDYPNITGICMISLECQQRSGTVIGACRDGHLFGACCHDPIGPQLKSSTAITEPTTTTTTTTTEPSSTGSSSSQQENNEVIPLSIDSEAQLDSQTAIPSLIDTFSELSPTFLSELALDEHTTGMYASLPVVDDDNEQEALLQRQRIDEEEEDQTSAANMISNEIITSSTDRNPRTSTSTERYHGVEQPAVVGIDVRDAEVGGLGGVGLGIDDDFKDNMIKYVDEIVTMRNNELDQPLSAEPDAPPPPPPAPAAVPLVAAAVVEPVPPRVKIPTSIEDMPFSTFTIVSSTKPSIDGNGEITLTSISTTGSGDTMLPITTTPVPTTSSEEIVSLSVQQSIAALPSSTESNEIRDTTESTAQYSSTESVKPTKFTFSKLKYSPKPYKPRLTTEKVIWTRPTTSTPAPFYDKPVVDLDPEDEEDEEEEDDHHQISSSSTQATSVEQTTIASSTEGGGVSSSYLSDDNVEEEHYNGGDSSTQEHPYSSSSYSSYGPSSPSAPSSSYPASSPSEPSSSFLPTSPSAPSSSYPPSSPSSSYAPPSPSAPSSSFPPSSPSVSSSAYSYHQSSSSYSYPPSSPSVASYSYPQSSPTAPSYSYPPSSPSSSYPAYSPSSYPPSSPSVSSYSYPPSSPSVASYSYAYPPSSPPAQSSPPVVQSSSYGPSSPAASYSSNSLTTSSTTTTPAPTAGYGFDWTSPTILSLIKGASELYLGIGNASERSDLLNSFAASTTENEIDSSPQRSTTWKSTSYPTNDGSTLRTSSPETESFSPSPTGGSASSSWDTSIDSFVDQVVEGIVHDLNKANKIDDIIFNNNKKQGSVNRKNQSSTTSSTTSEATSTVRTSSKETKTKQKKTSVRSKGPSTSSEAPVVPSTTSKERLKRVKTKVPPKTPVAVAASTNKRKANKNKAKPVKKVTTSSIKTANSTRKRLDYKKDCGVRPLIKKGRIVGGTPSQFGSWPWHALVKETVWWGIFSKIKCGGVLIGAQHVLTAAHCQPQQTGTLSVVLGITDSDDTDARAVTKIVKRIIPHPQFNPRTYENDIAILELESPVDFQPHVVPVCLPRDDDVLEGKTGHVTGMGLLKHDGERPLVLQEVDLPILNNTECQKMFVRSGNMKPIIDSFICAGYEQGRKDSCGGDSGGPLSVKRSNGQWVLAGTVSHGIKCGMPNLPGIYSRTSYYKPWIDRVLNMARSHYRGITRCNAPPRICALQRQHQQQLRQNQARNEHGFVNTLFRIFRLARKMVDEGRKSG